MEKRRDFIGELKALEPIAGDLRDYLVRICELVSDFSPSSPSATYEAYEFLSRVSDKINDVLCINRMELSREALRKITKALREGKDIPEIVEMVNKDFVVHSPVNQISPATVNAN